MAGWEGLMAEALREARAGYGRTGPNPLVGALVVRNGKVVGRGCHRVVGGDHAEVEALRDAGAGAAGADLVVTLEPCSHFGRTPPCTEAVAAAGIKRVVVGTLDPNPRERGRGSEILRSAGIEVVGPVLEEQCRRFNEAYFKYITTGLPLVTLKLAMSADGRIATARGDSQWFTDRATDRFTHRLRRDSNAIAVGGGTAAADDPSLTVRLATPRTTPVRMVVSGSLELPDKLQLWQQQDRLPTVVYCGRQRPVERVARLRSLGVTVEEIGDRSGKIEVAEWLTAVGRRGVARLLVEGGSGLAGSLLAAGAVDRLVIAYAPLLVGHQGIPAVRLTPGDVLARLPRMRPEWTRRSGADSLCSWRLGPDYCRQELGANEPEAGGRNR